MYLHLNDMAQYGRRNIAACSSGIGNWQSMINFIVFLAIPTNFAILLFARVLEDTNQVGAFQVLDEIPVDEQPAFIRYLMNRGWWTRTNVIILAIVIEHVLLLFSDLIDMILPDVPQMVKKIEKNRKLFEARALQEMKDIDSGHDESEES